MQSHITKGLSAPSTPTDLRGTVPCLWYDYAVQAWVEHGVYLDCNHPAHMRCTCYGRQHAGEAAAPSHCVEVAQ